MTLDTHHFNQINGIVTIQDRPKAFSYFCNKKNITYLN